jgi:hypothetical protein
MGAVPKSLEIQITQDFLTAVLATMKPKDRRRVVAAMAQIAEKRAQRAEGKVVSIRESATTRIARENDAEQLRLLRQMLPALLG